MHTVLETLCVKVTNRCNLSCHHCWSSSSPQPLDLSPNHVINFLDFLKPLGLKFVSLSGGEPTIYSHADFLIKELIKRGYYLSITTNGTNTQNIRALLNSLPKPMLQHLNFRVSIDGCKSTHEQIRGINTFDATLESIEQIVSVVKKVSFNTVIFEKPFGLNNLIKLLPVDKINNWALLTPVMRNLKSSVYENKEIFKNIKLWRNELLHLTPSTPVIIWDYLTHPNGGFVVEANGLLTLPGLNQNQDIIVGDIRSITPEIVQAYMKQRLKFDKIAYFSLSN